MYIKHVSIHIICWKRCHSLSCFSVVYHTQNPNFDFCLLKLLSHMKSIQVSRKMCGCENRHDSETGEAKSPNIQLSG